MGRRDGRETGRVRRVVASGDDGTPKRWSPGYLFSMARGSSGALACGCSDGVVRIYGDGSGGNGEPSAEVRDAHQNTMVGSTCFINEGACVVFGWSRWNRRADGHENLGNV